MAEARPQQPAEGAPLDDEFRVSGLGLTEPQSDQLTGTVYALVAQIRRTAQPDTNADGEPPTIFSLQ